MVDAPEKQDSSPADLTIADLAALIGRVVKFSGRIVFDRSRPDGSPRKLVDVARLRALGWSARIPLADGLRNTYAWYREHAADARAIAL